MKRLGLTFCFLISFIVLIAQKAENIIIITTDGLRWQEVFEGMDKEIASDGKFNQGDSVYLFNKYWNEDPNERRKLLLPFLWNTVEKTGQIFGNRDKGSKVDNANPYWFSYPGYSEIFTGFPDSAVNSNEYKANPNETVLEFLNRKPAFRGKVAAFAAWDAFDRILNEERAGFPVISAFDQVKGDTITTRQSLINQMLRDSYKPFGTAECLDVFTHYAGFEYLKAREPKVLYFAYGETDEWAHAGKYRDYLDAAHQVDQWISDLWNFVQGHADYRNKTVFFITTDHGRGDLKKSEWTSHGSSINDAHEIWFAAFGSGVKGGGEARNTRQLYQAQFAQTIAALLGFEFTASHPVAGKVEELF